jgi:hypothetical protein
MGNSKQRGEKMKTYVKDWWLWHKVSICQEHCDKCGTDESIDIEKSKINKLIRILKKLNYRKLPKRRTWGKEYIIEEETQNSEAKK